MPIPCDTLLTGSHIVTQNPERAIIPEGGVAITQGKIVAVGQAADLLQQFTPGRHLDFGPSIILPGLHNAHGHVAMTFLRGLGDDMPLMDWLTKRIFPVEKHLTAELVELASLLGCAEMMRTGTTSFVDMYLIEDAVGRAVDRAGMKVLAGEAIFSFPSPAYANADTAFALVQEQHDRWKDHKRVRICLTPHTVYTTNTDILTRCGLLASDLGIPLHIHVAETSQETAESMRQYGKRPLEVCREAGLLGPTTNVAHVVDITPEEIDLLLATRTQVSHNPKSNLKLASGFAPVPQMLEKGILPGLGTDGAASNNTLNMFGEMNICALIHKGLSKDPAVCPAQTVLDMATLGGAAAMFSDDTGSLLPGKAADITVLGIDSPNMVPMYAPVSHLVYAASGHEVRLTMIDGDIVYHDGKYPTIDLEGVRKEMWAMRQWILDKVE